MKENSVLGFIFFFFSLYFNIFLKLHSTLDMLSSTLDILLSTLDPRKLDTLRQHCAILIFVSV